MEIDIKRKGKEEEIYRKGKEKGREIQSLNTAINSGGGEGGDSPA